MKKNESLVGYGYGYVMHERMPEFLVGRILTIIEAIGLKESQEKSLKDLLKNEIYKISSRDEGTLWISPSLHNEIHRVTGELNSEQQARAVGSTMSVPLGVSDNVEFKITWSKTK